MAALLAFDTATDRIAVAVGIDARVWTAEGEGAAAASTTLLPTIRRLLAEADLRLVDLDAIAFGRGPGAFTGLRTACSVVQGLAFGAGLPVLAIDTTLIVAEDARRSVMGDEARAEGAFDTWVVIDARMGEIYAARYLRVQGEWRTLVAPSLWAPEPLRREIAATPCTAVAGNALTIHAGLADDGTALLQPQARPSAAALPVLAEAAWRRGEARDPADALPLYVRDKVASTTAERALASTARAAAVNAQKSPIGNSSDRRHEPSLPGDAALAAASRPPSTVWRSRPMRIADFDAVMDIEAQCYPFPWTRGNFIDAVASGYEAHLLLDTTGRPVGHAVAMVGVEELHVLNIAVIPSLQGTGGGRHLLRLLLDLCPGCGARSVWLEVRVGNERARHVYAHAGFAQVGLRRNYYPAANGLREDAVVMRRQVAEDGP